MVYLGMFSIILLFLLIGMDYRISLKRYMIIPLVMMTCIVGFRYHTGSDLNNYEFVYYRIINGIATDYEVLYRVIVHLVHFLHLNFQAVVLIHAIVSFSFIYLTMNNMCGSKMEAAIFITFFYAFMFTTYFTIMRQFMSAAIIAYIFSRDFKSKKEYVELGVLFLLACLSHTGAIVLIPIYLLFKSKIFESNVTRIVTLAVALFIGTNSYSLAMIGRLVEYFKRYAYYTLKTNFGSSEGAAVTVIFLSAIYVYLVASAYFCEERYEKAKKVSDAMAITLFVYFITLIVGWFHRAYWYTFIFAAFIPCWFRRRIPKIGKFDIGFLLILFACMYAVYFYLTLENTQPNMFPYQFRINIFE